MPYRPFTNPLTRLIFSCLVLTTLMGCQASNIYDPEARTVTHTLVGENTRLHKALIPLMEKHKASGSKGGPNGLYLLQDGLSAFVARATLIKNADVSLDLQYYIFANDTSGKTLISQVLRAADRGVRVRVLVDDLGTPIKDPWIATLDRHPNIELRIFNPVAARSGLFRNLEQAAHFSRVNHRMHNKLLVADGQAIVTGGRNIGDAYFSNNETFFQDVDILCFGPVVKTASESFDAYWNHNASVPVSVLLTPSEKALKLTDLREMATEHFDTLESSEYGVALKTSTLGQRLLSGDIPIEWGEAILYADPPDKATRRDMVGEDQYLVSKLRQVLSNAEEQLLISSAYFIPGENGVDFLSNLEKRGVEVSVLTNALSTTDVAVVHSGYSGYRKPLLESGIDLWELRSQAGQKRRLKWFKGESRASLHAKSFVIDHDRVIVGSVNLDGRSLIQNTEIGVYIKSPAINKQLEATYKEWTQPDFAWRLSLDEEDDLQWQAEAEDGSPIILHEEPESTGWQRFKVWLLSLLPIESQI
ncbi:phospholipase D family protein [Aestuariicella sp. G3-2]|uniref:phospholipase D family protein n=1 Tax=Pseudomaricurvus albidus TaxID=2842452 RepID=UPI001C0CEADF|nr:phospholipase D family protein [Aestuariicella albida]MBU3069862.1 phospholipase D family protein [Aestuariicella albida]